MIAYIIIYRDVIEHITAKPFSKCLTRLKVKVKFSHSLIAVGAVGVESHCILGTADERRSPSLTFRSLSLP